MLLNALMSYDRVREKYVYIRPWILTKGVAPHFELPRKGDSGVFAGAVGPLLLATSLAAVAALRHAAAAARHRTQKTGYYVQSPTLSPPLPPSVPSILSPLSMELLGSWRCRSRNLCLDLLSMP